MEVDTELKEGSLFPDSSQVNKMLTQGVKWLFPQAIQTAIGYILTLCSK